jgi:hypothetical protein
LFESDFPFCPPYSFFSEAYRSIGAVDAADRLETAVAMYPFEKPHQVAQKRNEFMDSLEESHKMFELGDQVCGDRSIWLALERSVNRNAATFLVM